MLRRLRRRPVAWVLSVRNEVDTAHIRVHGLTSELRAGDQLLVVDNASSDSTADALFDRFGDDPHVRVFTARRRLGEPERHVAALVRDRSVRSMASGDAVQPVAVARASELIEPVPLREPAPDTVAGRVLLMPAAAYHLDELGPLADELERRGQPSVFYGTGWRWKHIRKPLRRQRQPVVDWDGAGDWVDRLAGVVTLNDWGEPLRDIVERANQAGIPTFGKVEGVQDFEDVDVHWRRNAYRTAATALCQGSNDVAALGEHPSVTVGNTRLEAIWAEGPAREVRPVAIINLNFTYGVMEDARDAWLADAVAAATAAGLHPLVSRHPAEHAPIDGVEVADRSMAHLLEQGGVLISRFSTVPFEAIARGVPFVYYNPHGERVPGFGEPNGAFEVATDEVGLADCLRRAVELDPATFRRQAEPFFRAQIDIDPAADSARRTADAILAAIGRRKELR